MITNYLINNSDRSNSNSNIFKSNKVVGNSKIEMFSSKQKIRKSSTQNWNIANKPNLTKESEQICRICLSGLSAADDPLISPCGCSGTMKYIHSSCLKLWLDSNKTIVDEEFCTTIKWDVITCELCKQQFLPEAKTSQKHNSNRKSEEKRIFDFEKPPCDHYVVFELLNTDIKYEEKVKVYLIFNFYENELSIGRSSEVNVKIKDSTISRIHAYLKLLDEDIYLIDSESRYGCLYLLKEPLVVTAGCNTHFIQINCTYKKLCIC